MNQLYLDALYLHQYGFQSDQNLVILHYLILKLFDYQKSHQKKLQNQELFQKLSLVTFPLKQIFLLILFYLNYMTLIKEHLMEHYQNQDLHNMLLYQQKLTYLTLLKYVNILQYCVLFFPNQKYLK